MRAHGYILLEKTHFEKNVDNGTDDSILRGICITIWIHEFKDFVSTFIINVRGAGPWQMYAVFKCYCFM